MGKAFEDRVMDAVRVVGPDATAAAVYGELVADTDMGFWALLFGPSVGGTMSALARLRDQGFLKERVADDDRGRPRRLYSMGTGRRRPTTPSWGVSASALA